MRGWEEEDEAEEEEEEDEEDEALDEVCEGHPQCTSQEGCVGGPDDRLVRHVINGAAPSKQMRGDTFCLACWRCFLSQNEDLESEFV